MLDTFGMRHKSSKYSSIKSKWSFAKALKIFNMPFFNLLDKARAVHKKNFVPNSIQISALLSIKTGACPEDCAYCPQSAHYNTKIEKEPLLDLDEIIEAAKKAKDAGATRFCMGAAWRAIRDRDLDFVLKAVANVKELGMETCLTAGSLKDTQAAQLKKAGLDFYNHNIDTSEEFYSKIITTRSFKDRLGTLETVSAAGIGVCCGGIIGMGESNEDRIKMLLTLANLKEPPQSVPINKLIKIPGTPLESADDIDNFDFIRIIALARIVMPRSYIRLSAGRTSMSDELQALAFMAGANSLFYGDKLLTAENPSAHKDTALLERLGLQKST